MPKRVFWPVAMVVMGVIFIASNMGLLPIMFWNLWPVVLIVVGLGGLLVSDKEEWDGQTMPVKKSTKKVAKKSSQRKK
ncbi:hypothetical protein KA017_03155 [Candidatus Woesebacteria bacterium]|nr:hypothetical protein [Candidatus Woesebacteria bacterium]